MTQFTDLNLNPKILSALEDKGYKTPTPIQAQAIPKVLSRQDVLGIAQTGTGKTAAFSLPMIHNLAASKKSVKSGSARALILTPTRELASQISENVEAYSKELKLRHSVIYGGVSDKPQITALQAGVDILIATPGRLMDLMSQGYIRLMNLEMLVLDEADRMLDMGFIGDIKKITARVPASRQTILFSATMPKSIIDLANSLLKDPAKIEITPESTTVDRIEQKINFVSNYDRPKLLKHIIKQKSATMVMVFCRTKHGADDVEELLERSGIPAAAIHGNKDQDSRERSLNAFRDGRIKVLVATDVAARGIDISSISHVINYDIPSDPESYVHRIGRTARAGKKGVAISFCDPKDTTLLEEVEKTINFKIPVDDSHPFSNKKPAPSKSKEGNTKTSRKPNNKENKQMTKSKKNTKTQKKGGILNFLKNLFSSKSPAKPSKSKAKSNSPHKNKKPSNRTRSKTDNRRKPSPSRDNKNANNNSDRPKRQRPVRSTESKPRPVGMTRKISSGKKPPKND